MSEKKSIQDIENMMDAGKKPQIAPDGGITTSPPIHLLEDVLLIDELKSRIKTLEKRNREIDDEAFDYAVQINDLKSAIRAHMVQEGYPGDADLVQLFLDEYNPDNQ